MGPPRSQNASRTSSRTSLFSVKFAIKMPTRLARVASCRGIAAGTVNDKLGQVTRSTARKTDYDLILKMGLSCGVECEAGEGKNACKSLVSSDTNAPPRAYFTIK